MSLQIKNYTRNLDSNSNVVAFVSFYIPEWRLHLNSCKYIRSKNGGFFIGFPSKEKDDKYYPYFCFEGDASKRFQDSARKLIEEHLAKMNVNNVEQSQNNTQNVDEHKQFDLF